jgi:L-ribulose-5-phosphate 3-epimerase
MYKYGIMQGRLTSPKDNRIQFFPKDGWTEEFKSAAQIGFDYIEWLYDLHDENINPIKTDRGIEKIKSLSVQNGIQVKSLCAHCFIEDPILGANDSKLKELLDLFDWLLQRSYMVGINRIILPLEDASLIKNIAELEHVENWLRKALSIAEKTRIEIDLETTLDPAILISFLNKILHPLLKVNYDIGNSAGMGYCLKDEFAGYGHRIGSIHIKDKLLQGPTVPLGTGSSDIEALAFSLQEINFKGDIVLEVARGVAGTEIPWAQKNLKYVVQNLERKI